MEQESSPFQQRRINSEQGPETPKAEPDQKTGADLDSEKLRPAAPAVPLLQKKENFCAWPSEDRLKKDEPYWSIHPLEEEDSFYSPELTEKLLAYLIKLEILNPKQAEDIRRDIGRTDHDLVDSILDKRYLKESQIGQAIATYFGKTYLNFSNVFIRPDVMGLVPKHVCQKNGLVVFDEDETSVKVAMVNPQRLHLIHLIEKKTGKRVKVHCTIRPQIEAALKNYTGEFEDKFQSLFARASQNLEHLDSLDSISQIFDTLVLMAFQRGASDVHIEPLQNEVRVRFRIDGVLKKVVDLPTEFLETVINHIKVLAHLRTDTHNAFQDGRFHVNYEETTINFRVSLMPTHYGEKSVLRLLSTEAKGLTLTDLGYSEKDRALIEGYITKSNGMILATGPTGSGKTTTLYAMLKELNREGVNISSIEDPIEYGLDGVNQTQVNEKTNITFAEGLRSILRQDPDILMIGEVRDFETGKIAVNSALTGHLVFSTLHTNNASLASLRMLQMGIDPYLIVNTVDLIIAQRLVRRVCSACITSYTLNPDEIEHLKTSYLLQEFQRFVFEKYFGDGTTEDLRLYKGAGCDKCGHSGYKGRLVISELLEVKDDIAELILQNATEHKIQAAAEKAGMTTMLEDGIQKVLDGLTTLEEVLRVINQ